MVLRQNASNQAEATARDCNRKRLRLCLETYECKRCFSNGFDEKAGGIGA
jgi:hypothetical protein